MKNPHKSSLIILILEVLTVNRCKKNDLDANDCQEFGWNMNTVCDGGMPPGCWFDKVNGWWVYNSCGGSDKFLDETHARAIVCK